MPKKIALTSRAPSYKAIAMCILRNDLHLRGLGFDNEESELCLVLRDEMKKKTDRQIRLI